MRALRVSFILWKTTAEYPELVTRSGWAGQDLARLLDVGPDVMSRIRQGHRRVPDWLAPRIAAATGIPFDDLFHDPQPSHAAPFIGPPQVHFGIYEGDHFDLSVDRRGPDECWPWKGPTYPTGYGCAGRNGYAHRLAWSRVNGPIPEGLVVRHSCDNRACLNPAHLLIGTQADNVRDRDERGRHRVLRGSESPSAKITEADVIRIRELWQTHSGREIAPMYGLAPATIHMIASGRTWTHVPMPENRRTRRLTGRKYGPRKPVDRV